MADFDSWKSTRQLRDDALDLTDRAALLVLSISSQLHSTTAIGEASQFSHNVDELLKCVFASSVVLALNLP